ncbi:MAG: TolC family protein [Desulfobulbaceae bacterium]|nr:TolC family protein [Desulfobulbaceae bacterium]
MMQRLLLVLSVLLLLAACTVKPQPSLRTDVEERAYTDLKKMIADQKPMGDTPITLYDAMARAITYNLDHRLKMMEKALEIRQLDASRYDLLPKLSATAGYSRRNNDFGSYSESLIDGSQSLVASTSQERNSYVSDISVMWNVLDFGVSYIRANQQADRILIMEERRRKVIQNIIQDVRYAYWRAVSAEVLIKDMVTLLGKTREALERSKEISGQRLQAPREALEYQKALLENIRLLWGIIQKLTPAKVELATLMNISPGTDFQLEVPDWGSPHIPSVDVAVEKMEYMAMISRPELKEEDYRKRISALEAKKAILNMLPGIKIDFGYNYDKNDFLYNSSWWDAGAYISQNIFDLVSGPEKYRNATAKQEIDDIRRQAVSMAVLMQVHLAYQRYHLIRKEYRITRNLDEVTSRLNVQVIQEVVAGSANELAAIQSATNAMVARMRHHLTYAELQNAIGRVYNSIGIDPLPSELASVSLPSLSRSMEKIFTRWERVLDGSIKITDGFEMPPGIRAILAKERDEEEHRRGAALLKVSDKAVEVRNDLRKTADIFERKEDTSSFASGKGTPVQLITRGDIYHFQRKLEEEGEELKPVVISMNSSNFSGIERQARVRTPVAALETVSSQVTIGSRGMSRESIMDPRARRY